MAYLSELRHALEPRTETEDSVTKQHVIRAAEMVRAIRDKHWTNDPPDWMPKRRRDWWILDVFQDHGCAEYTRAVATAEAFIILFREFNPRFNQERFLVACGLAEPTKKGRT